MPLYIVNSTTDTDGKRIPVEPATGPWVGNIYQKTGNVFKYLLLTPQDITGLPGVFGPVTQEQVADAIEADGGTLRGWNVDEVPSWSVSG